MKKAVITGPTGEIGIALLELLAQKKIEILAIVRPDSRRLKYLPKSPYIKILKCDLSELNTICSNGAEYDVFFHFGWCASYGEERTDLYLQNRNVAYTLDAVNLAERLGCKLFIGAGSQAEYGRKTEPLTPQTAAMPETAYGIAKLCAGQLSRLACQEKNIKHIWVRVSSVYGPADGPYTLITYMMRQIRMQKDILLTECKQIWDFLYAEDAANAFFLLAENPPEKSLYCLGGGERRPLSDYIEEIRKLINDVGEYSQIQIGAKEYSENQMMFLSTDIKDLQSDVGFVPTTTFAAGIRKTYEWYCNNVEVLPDGDE